jgi:hypothetical protein
VNSAVPTFEVTGNVGDVEFTAVSHRQMGAAVKWISGPSAGNSTSAPGAQLISLRDNLPAAGLTTQWNTT